MSVSHFQEGLKIESDLLPWWNKRWELNKSTLEPQIKIDERYDENVSLTNDELLLLVYLYFTKREVTGMSVISCQEIAELLGYKYLKSDTRISQRVLSIIEGVSQKCAPDKNKSIEVRFYPPEKIGWEKNLIFKISPVQREKKKKGYLQIGSHEFAAIWKCSPIRTGESNLNKDWPFHQLLTVYMYIKTFFSSTTVNDNFIGWAGWRSSRLGEKDLHMSHQKYSKIREYLVKQHVLYRNTQNPALYATADNADLWASVQARWPHRWGKNHESLTSTGFTNEIPLQPEGFEF